MVGSSYEDTMESIGDALNDAMNLAQGRGERPYEDVMDDLDESLENLEKIFDGDVENANDKAIVEKAEKISENFDKEDVPGQNGYESSQETFRNL